MDGVLAALYGSDPAAYLRTSRWGYAAVNTAHVASIALLVGAILPLDLRLLGCWRSVPRAGLVRVLTPVAGAGLAGAILTGMLLFSVRATEYGSLPILGLKLGLIMLGAGSALAMHLFYGRWLDDASQAVLARAGALSLVCWLGALICGRMIAFVGS